MGSVSDYFPGAAAAVRRVFSEYAEAHSDLMRYLRCLCRHAWYDLFTVPELQEKLKTEQDGLEAVERDISFHHGEGREILSDVYNKEALRRLKRIKGITQERIRDIEDVIELK